MSGRQSFGVVATFDDFKGYGTVRMPDGRELFFHCTAIADGTRTIEIDTPVTFERVPGHRGQWEAHDLRATSVVSQR
jgi:cold shock CspA family protein